MSSTKKKKRSNVLLSSDDDEDSAVVASPKLSRSSLRLKTKSERKTFVLPTRDKIWDSIPSQSDYSSKKSLKRLSPRKSVNNFTKVHNSYNFDDYEDTSNDDSEGFLSESSGNNKSDDSSDEQCKSGRVKNYRRRIKFDSSSDEEGKGDINKFDSLKPESCQSGVEEERPVDKCGTGDDSQTNTFLNEFADYENNNVSANDNSDSDENISPVRRHRKRNSSVLESDRESEGSHCSDTDSSPDDEVPYPVGSRSSNVKKKKEQLFQAFRDVQKLRKSQNERE